MQTNRLLRLCLASVFSAGLSFGQQLVTFPIGAPVFSGGGLNDMAANGQFIGTTNVTYTITIGSTVTQFNWTATDGGSGTGVAITGGTCINPISPATGWQVLSHGVQVCWLSSTGHTAATYWVVTVTANGTVAQASFVGRGVGNTTRSQQDKSRESISVLDAPGVIGDGINDDGAGVQLAVNNACIKASQNIAVRLIFPAPPLRYHWTTPISPPAGCNNVEVDVMMSHIAYTGPLGSGAFEWPYGYGWSFHNAIFDCDGTANWAFRIVGSPNPPATVNNGGQQIHIYDNRAYGCGLPGLNDITANVGIGPTTAQPWVIKISNVGANDQFEYSLGGGAFSAPITITAANTPITVINNLTLSFASVSGHTLGTAWAINVDGALGNLLAPARLIGGFVQVTADAEKLSFDNNFASINGDCFQTAAPTDSFNGHDNYCFSFFGRSVDFSQSTGAVEINWQNNNEVTMGGGVRATGIGGYKIHHNEFEAFLQFAPWSATTTYTPGVAGQDYVSYCTGSGCVPLNYYAVATSTNQVPPNATYWAAYPDFIVNPHQAVNEYAGIPGGFPITVDQSDNFSQLHGLGTFGTWLDDNSTFSSITNDKCEGLFPTFPIMDQWCVYNGNTNGTNRFRNNVRLDTDSTLIAPLSPSWTLGAEYYYPTDPGIEVWPIVSGNITDWQYLMRALSTYESLGSLTGATWAGGVETYTNSIKVETGQLVTITGAAPYGINVEGCWATNLSSTTFSCPVPVNPGTWTSSTGTVFAVDATQPIQFPTADIQQIPSGSGVNGYEILAPGGAGGNCAYGLEVQESSAIDAARFGEACTGGYSTFPWLTGGDTFLYYPGAVDIGTGAGSVPTLRLSGLSAEFGGDVLVPNIPAGSGTLDSVCMSSSTGELYAGGCGITSINGTTGAFTTGPGLGNTGTVLQNAGVVAFGGQTGAITLGTGLGMSGNQLQLTGSGGVTSLGSATGAIGLGTGLAISSGNLVVGGGSHTYSGVPTGCTFTGGTPSACTSTTITTVNGLVQ